MVKHYCTRCHRLVCKESTYQGLWLSAGVVWQRQGPEAPRLVCSCGRVLILLKGKA